MRGRELRGVVTDLDGTVAEMRPDGDQLTGYDTCAAVAAALEHKYDITVEIEMPDSAIDVAREMASGLADEFGRQLSATFDVA
jgi:hypothetical protein